jgi:hypothetical protein
MDSFVIRLWHRVGTLRAVGILVLVAGLLFGGYAIAGRQTQQDTAEPVKAADAAALPKATAGPSTSQSAEQAAQSKAQDAASAAAAQAKAAEDAARKKKEEEASRSTRPAGEPSYPAPASCAVYTGNRNTGCTLMVAAGFALGQMPCLDKLWTKESGWNPNAHNNGSGAHGIPQAVPGDKMAAYGPNWRTDATTQIKWGLGYIKGRYKTPCKAWGHSQNSGWY